MISKWAYNYLTERLSCARVLPSVSATPLLYRLADGAGVRNVVIYEKVSSYLRWIWCPFSGKMTFFEGKSVIVVNCCYRSTSCAVVVAVVLKALLANRIYSRMTQGKNSSASVYRSWNTSSPEVEMFGIVGGILFVIDYLSKCLHFQVNLSPHSKLFQSH